jgi:hypothetical protein
MPISGPSIMKFDNEAPVTLRGSWNVRFSIPEFRSYGQGEVGANGKVKPGSGYQGSSLGTQMNVSGSFRATCDSTGENVKKQILSGAFRFFTLDFPVGDPGAATVKAKGIDCHFSSVTIENDSENAKLEISGELTAGKLEGVEPDDL